MGKEDEMILVVERSLLERLGGFHGLSFDTGRYLDSLLDPANQRFIRRGDAEEDPSLKQLIPYCVVRCGQRVLRYTRGSGGGEQRLHALQSIGIGGHINDVDASHGGGGGLNDGSTYQRAVERELSEELRLPPDYANQIVALLNDDSDPVGQVHLGVVHRISVADTSQVAAAEDEIADLEWVDASDLAAARGQLESWSAHCAAHIARLLATA